jgi:GntR family phosphonate transport system transcriptional regulator
MAKQLESTTMIQRGSGVAIWRQIEQNMEEDIRRGAYKPGERLPTETELAGRFEVNRHTIRRAVAALEVRGLVRVEQGRGIFLQDYAINYTVGKRTRFSENLRRQQRSGGAVLLRSLILPATQQVAQGLGLEAGALVLQLDTLREVEGRIVGYASHFFEAKRFADLASVFAETGSITEALKQYGIADYQRRDSKISARLPDSTVAKHLQQPKSQPILYVEAVNVDMDGKPIEYGIARYAGDAVQLIVNQEDSMLI